MSRWKRLGVVVLIIVASAACVGLGYWQLTRHNARAAQIDLIETNLDAEVVPATDLLGDSLTDGLAPADVWRPVEVRGTWVADSGVQLRNRPVDGANASHALGLLRTESGTLLVVDRGWWRQTDVVPTGALDVPDGEVTLVIRLRAAETGDDRSPPLGQVYWIVPEDVVSQGFDGAAPAEVASASLVRDAYGIVASPRPAEPLQLLPDPDATFGSNLSYAFQWWFFALAIPVAGVILARRARRTPLRRRRSWHREAHRCQRHSKRRSRKRPLARVTRTTCLVMPERSPKPRRCHCRSHRLSRPRPAPGTPPGRALRVAHPPARVGSAVVGRRWRKKRTPCWMPRNVRSLASEDARPARPARRSRRSKGPRRRRAAAAPAPAPAPAPLLHRG